MSKDSANKQPGHGYAFWKIKEFNSMNIGHFVPADHFVTTLSSVERNRILGGDIKDMGFRG